MTLKKVNSKHHGFANMLADYQLANEMNMESFLSVLEMAESVKNNLKNLVIASFDGDKEVYFVIKESILNIINSVFEQHDKITEEMYKVKIKDKH